MRSRRAWRVPRLVTVLLVLVVGLGLAAACSGKGDSSSSTASSAGGGAASSGPPGTLRLGVAGVSSVDPASLVPTDATSLMLSDLLFDGLTASDPTTGAAVPALAERWSPDAAMTQWTFTLRADARFSDGAPVTAADVKASLERLAGKGSASLAGARLELVSEVAAPDPHTVVVALRTPYSLLPELLAAPEMSVVKQGTADAAFAWGSAFAAPTSGPYRFAGQADGGAVRLERAGTVGPAAMEVSTFADSGAAYRAFVDGSLDWSPVPEDQAADADGRGVLERQPFQAEVWFGLNLADPRFQELRLRQAILAAVDRDRIVREVLPGWQTMRGTVPAGVPGAIPDPCGDPCRYDPSAAKALLAAAYPDGAIPTVPVDIYDDATQRKLADALKADLAAVGITVEVRVHPFADYRAFAASGQQAMFSFGWVGVGITQDAYLGPLFLSDSSDNVTGFRVTSVDDLIHGARANADASARTKAYQDAERQVMAQVPLVPLAQFQVSAAVDRSRVQGWHTRLDGTMDLAPLVVAGG